MYENSTCLILADSIWQKNFTTPADTRNSVAYQIMNRCPVNVSMCAFSGMPLIRHASMPAASGYGVDQKAVITAASFMGLDNLVICLGYNDWSTADLRTMRYYKWALIELLSFAIRLNGIGSITLISPILSPDDELTYHPGNGIQEVNDFKLQEYRNACYNAYVKFYDCPVPIRFLDGLTLVPNDPLNFVGPHLTGVGAVELANNFVDYMQGQGVFPSDY